MQCQPTFLGLLRETTELTKETRPQHRTSHRPHLNQIIKRELMKMIPPSLKESGLNPLESIFLSVLATDNELCIDAIRIFSNFWSDSYEDAIKLQLQLLYSIYEGELSSFLIVDDRERLRIHNDKTKVVMEMIVPHTGYQRIRP